MNGSIPDQDRAIREELRRAKAQPRRTPRLRRIFLPLLLAAAVLGALAFAALRDLNSVDSLRRMLSYNKIEQNEDGKAELFRYDSDRSARYELFDGMLLTVSSTRIQLTSAKGEELWSSTVSFASPGVELGAHTAAVYDVGGRELYLLGARGLVRGMNDECGNGLISVSINGSDYLALTTLKSGYRSAVTVYDPSGQPVFTFNSSERYVFDGCVLGDNRHLAAVTLGEEDGMFSSTLSIYAFDSEKAVSASTLSGSMALSLENLGNALAVVEDTRMTVFNADGSLRGSYRYEYPYLRGFSGGGNGFATLLLSRYRSGSSLRLVNVDMEGMPLGTLDAREEILSVSAAGRYVAVLYSDSLKVYDPAFEEISSLDDTDFAKQVIMRGDGSALLLGASRAWLFVPK